jgi:hypothetical protein
MGAKILVQIDQGAMLATGCTSKFIILVVRFFVDKEGWR